MVVEIIIDGFLNHNHKMGVIVAGFIYTLIALFLAKIVFPSQASLFFVFLVVLAFVPFVYKTIMTEENYDYKYDKGILKKHATIIWLYLLLFIGVVFAVALVYIISQDPSTMFSVQEKVISGIRSGTEGNVINMGEFTKILLNNLKVLSLCLAFSFLYGLGAIFILTWNASVVGVAIGQTFEKEIVKISSFIGLDGIASYFNIASYSVLRYLTHGIFEIAGYFTIGLAGSIISVAVLRHHYTTKRFYNIMMDSYFLILISVGLIFIGAIIEAYLTPVLF